MTTSTDVRGARPALDGTSATGRTPAAGMRWTVPGLILVEAVALFAQAVAAALSRRGDESWGLGVTFLALALAFAWPMGLLVVPRLTRSARNAAVLALGLVPTLQYRATDPLLFTGFDEELHLRTLVDITTSHSLGQPNPLLPVSPHYPGLESVAAVFEQLGLPMVAAATITVLLARVVLVLVLSRAVEDLTGSVRAAGLAVATYATCQQFYFFNSQFAYETLAVPLALAAVACIRRALRSTDPRPAMWAASICIVAVTATHHVTDLLLTGFLLGWALSHRRRPGARVLWLATLVAVVTMAAWTASQWSALVAYFGPVIRVFVTELSGTGQHRPVFADSGGVTTPLWERLIIVYYAVTIALVTVWATFPRLRETRIARWALPRRARGAANPRTGLLIVLLAVVVPLTFAARSLPEAGEFGNRATAFLFLPLSALVGVGIVRLRERGVRAGRAARRTVVLLATALYVGGIVLGNGPDWQRLPGQWLASAENRSMDTETLAAAQWARNNLPPGSRIAADRISGDLLASRARLWPVSREGHADPASLYFAPSWDVAQIRTMRQLHLQYLYADVRLATQLPHVGVYFHAGETATPQQLTRPALTKWDQALGITVVYRHGPVTIYDLSGLDVGPRTTGWTGNASAPGLPGEIGFGLMLGLVVVGLIRVRWAAGIRRRVRELGRSCGPAIGCGVALSALCVGSTVALLAHAWTGPLTFATAAVVVLVAHRRRVVAALRRLPALRIPRVAPGIVTLLLLAVIVTTSAALLAIQSARLADVTAVEQILGHGAGNGGSGQ